MINRTGCQLNFAEQDRHHPIRELIRNFLMVGEENGKFSYVLGNVMGRGCPWDRGGTQGWRQPAWPLTSVRRSASPRLGLN